MPDDKSQAIQWKKKYFSTLEELEKLEQQSADNETLLRRSLLSLSLALDGFDDRLDQQLDKLRKDTRAGRKPLHIGQASEEISTLGQQLSKQIQARPQGHQLLLRLLEQLTLPAALQKQQKSLSRELNQRHAATHIDAHLDKLTILLRAAQTIAKKEATSVSDNTETTEPPSLQPDKNSGFFGRLFNKETPAPPSSAIVPNKAEISANSEQLRQLINEVSLPLPFSEQLNKISQQLDASLDRSSLDQLISQIAQLLSTLPINPATPNDDGTVAPINDILLQLLDRITLVDPYAQELEALREELSTQQNQQLDISLFLEQLTTLISRAQSLSQDEKQELEGFLLHITETLAEIDSHIRGTKDHQQHVQDSSQKLDDAVQNQVEGIQSSMLEANNLDELKHCIQSRLTTIREQVKSFRNENDERQQLMEQEMGSLISKVSRIENESEKLKKNLEQQREKSMRDPLTGVSNRLAYDEFLKHEFSSWQRRKHALTMVVWDIDHFKKVNDEYGHQAGDKALTIVAQLLKKRLRDSDYLARYGGEEFVSLLPETPISAALPLANELRETIKASELHYNDQRVLLTISCGLAEFHDGDTPESVFQRADAALYLAKEQGRNRCVAESDVKNPALGGHD